MLQFGKGARTWLRINIAIAELYKFVPWFLREFEVRLEMWESGQNGMQCLIKKRVID